MLMYSPTRQKFLEKKAEMRRQREYMKNIVVCRGTIETRGETSPCEYALFPRSQEFDAIITCHRCHTGHIKTEVGWRTFEEEEARKGRM